jgi:hypothetical protein
MSVYFVRNKLTGNIKVGLTFSPVPERVRRLQTGCDGELEVLHVVDGWGRDEEAFIHRYLRQQNVRGEWFQPSGDLLRWIDLLKAERELSDEMREVLRKLHEARLTAAECFKRAASVLNHDERMHSYGVMNEWVGAIKVEMEALYWDVLWLTECPSKPSSPMRPSGLGWTIMKWGPSDLRLLPPLTDDEKKRQDQDDGGPP